MANQHGHIVRATVYKRCPSLCHLVLFRAVVFNLGYAKTSEGVRKIKKKINILFMINSE